MKINGELIGAPEPRTVVFRRGEKFYPFTVQAVLDYTPFDEVCIRPQPAIKQVPGKEPEKLINDDYRKAVAKYFDRRTDWTIIMSLAATEGLVWEKVDLSRPDTWELFREELNEAGLTTGEVNYLVNAVTEVNTVSEDVMREARESFFHSNTPQQET